MKRIGVISLMLAVTVLAGVFLLSTQAQAAEAVASGACGDTLTWILDDTGTLTISGSGKMNSLSNIYAAPWYGIRLEIKRIIVEDGITYIPQGAFYGCSNVEHLTIPFVGDSKKPLPMNTSTLLDTSLEYIVLTVVEV